MNAFVTALFDIMTSIATSFGPFLAAVFTGIVSLFWTPGNGSDPGSITFFGVILLISVVATVVYWAFRLITSLVSRIGSKR